MAAEYIIHSGNPRIILCERSIRTFDTTIRNTLDLGGVAYIKAMTSFPVIVDPSHGTGKRDLVHPMAKAAVLAGADGLIIEVHPDPKNALCDGLQSLTPEEFSELMTELNPVCEVARKKLA